MPNAELIELKDLPIPRIQFRWEEVPKEVWETWTDQQNENVNFGYICHHEYVIPHRYMSQKEMGKAPETDGWCIEVSTSKLMSMHPEYHGMKLTRNGFSGRESPAVPVLSPLDPQYFSNAPIVVISSDGRAWRLPES